MLLGILVFVFPWTPRLAYLQKWDGFRLLSGKPSGTLAQIPLLAKERMNKVTDWGGGGGSHATGGLCGVAAQRAVWGPTPLT